MTDSVIIALISLFPSIVSLIMGLINHSQGKEIHTLVNSKMSAALAEIERLKKLVDAKYVPEAK